MSAGCLRRGARIVMICRQFRVVGLKADFRTTSSFGRGFDGLRASKVQTAESTQVSQQNINLARSG